MKTQRGEHVFQWLGSRVIIGVLAIITLFLAGGAIISIFTDIGSGYGGVATAFATIVLVLVTFRYVSLTQELVEETRQSRIEERIQHEYDDLVETNSLRHALRAEIGAISGISDYADTYTPRSNIFEEIIPTTVYTANAARIGQLSEEEIDVVVEYYTHVLHVHELIQDQRAREVRFQSDFLTESFDTTEDFLNSLIGLIPWFGGPSEYTLFIREQLGIIEDKQNEAVEILDEHLEKTDQQIDELSIEFEDRSSR